MDCGKSGRSPSRTRWRTARLAQRLQRASGRIHHHDPETGTVLSGGGKTGRRHTSISNGRGSCALPCALRDRIRKIWLLGRHSRRERCGRDTSLGPSDPLFRYVRTLGEWKLKAKASSRERCGESRKAFESELKYRSCGADL